jgi:hypothetical protein
MKNVLLMERFSGSNFTGRFRVVDKSRIIRVLGHLDDSYIEELAQALYAILGLSI